jgi:hypothetical protein
MVLVPRAGYAQEGVLGNVKAVLDTNISTGTLTTTDASGAVTKNDTTTVFPQLTVTGDTMIYPKLRLSFGGIFDVTQSSLTTDTGSSDFSVSHVRPYIELRSTDPVLSPGLGYFRRDETTSTGGGSPSIRLTNEDYSAYLGWRPAGGPRSDFQFVRTNTYDDTRLLDDSKKDFGSIISRYSYKGLGVSYLGSYLDTDNRVVGLETREVANAVRVDQSAALFHNRVLWAGTYNINHQNLTTLATGTGGEVPIPVIAFAGLSAISDTPVTTPLAQNPALVDGNLTSAAGVNIGFPGFGGDTQARNLGLDFATPSTVSRLLVWIDRDLPQTIAASFTWEIYSSSDNLSWSRVATVAGAPFGPFDRRFQIDFDPISARYIKTVTQPLSGVTIGASQYPDIVVTEVQAFLRETAGQAQAAENRTAQLINSDLRVRLLDGPNLYFENSYSYSGVAPGPHQDILSNGISFLQPFARIFSVRGRAAREQGTEIDGRRVAFVSNASFTVTPVPNLSASLLYNGLSEDIAGRSDDRRTIFLQTNTHLYRGVDFQFGGGWTDTTDPAGRSARDGLLNASAVIVPQPNLTFTVNYADTTTRPTTGQLVGQEFRTRRGYLSVAYDPVRTLRLVFAEELLDSTGNLPLNSHNIAVDWAPFQDGALQFFVAYNEMLRDLQYGREKTFRPGVRWTFSRQSYVDVSYQRIRSEYIYQATDAKIFSIDLKVFLY